ncbi:MAG: hypothetical protein ACREA4_00480 [Nitrososphaera sp.]
MDFKDVWLEVRPCTDGEGIHTTIDSDKALLVPALSEVLSAAERTSATTKDPGVWDYSRRLDGSEITQVMDAVKFVVVVEDARSVSRSTNVNYGTSSYTLTLFAMK